MFGEQFFCFDIIFVNAQVWLRFYMLLFRLLAERELTYLDAFLLAMKYLLKDDKASQEKTL
jgi:hypothetical protein